jgi:HEPN domain-containing protein
MSVANRWADWQAPARPRLEHPEDAAGDGRHAWACFAAHQASEKAVKALHLRLGQEAWGHVVARLLAELPAASSAPTRLVDAARVLDTFYIPTRYPDSHAAGPPFEHYGPLQGEEARRHARDILAFVDQALAER